MLLVSLSSKSYGRRIISCPWETKGLISFLIRLISEFLEMVDRWLMQCFLMFAGEVAMLCWWCKNNKSCYKSEALQCSSTVAFPHKEFLLQKCHVITTTGNRRMMKGHFDAILVVWKYGNIMADNLNFCSDFVHTSALISC